jgi:hypothetical protein
MTRMTTSFICTVVLGIAILMSFIFLLADVHMRNTIIAPFISEEQQNMSPYSMPCDESRTCVYGWQAVGHTLDEQARLRDMSIMIAAWPSTAEDNVPSVPCLSADDHLLILSTGASRVRYGTSVTFIMVHPTDVNTVLPSGHSAKPLSSQSLSLWCFFDDGSVTPAYSYDSKYGNDRASLLDCPLSPFAADELWRYNRTLRVYLASTTGNDRNTPIAKAHVSAPKRVSMPVNSSQLQLTLCTSPLHDGADYLTQWIQFHFLVGFRKFAVYNTTDTRQRLGPVIDAINRKHPNLVDVIQWNFSSLGLKDVLSTRYFQTEALHDCLIRYGDQSEWLGMLDLDEYIVPMAPYTSVAQYLYDGYGRRIIGSVNLWSHFFCTQLVDKYTGDENNTSRLVIERFTLRASNQYKQGREKYLYRPRFIQYLSIHHQIVGLAKQDPSPNTIMLAHYIAMNRPRVLPGCDPKEYVTDTTTRDRFASKVKEAMRA